jgi:tetratricopeptide (TPR) repeat protein
MNANGTVHSAAPPVTGVGQEYDQTKWSAHDPGAQDGKAESRCHRTKPKDTDPVVRGKGLRPRSIIGESQLMVAPSRVASSVVASVALIALSPLGAQGTGTQGFSSAYEAVVERYARGDHEAAVRTIGNWQESNLRAELVSIRALARRAERCGVCEETLAFKGAPLEAATLLHTDREWLDRKEGTLRREPMNVAKGLIELLRQDRDAARRNFARKWYYATVLRAQSENSWNEAIQVANEGLEAFPDATDLQLALACLEEGLGSVRGARASADRLGSANPHAWDEQFRDAAEKQGHLERAQRLLVQVRQSGSISVEATLRLARVSWRLGHTQDARTLLEELSIGATDPPAHYLRELFLGRVYEDLGSLAKAVEAYRSAAAIGVGRQRALIALSHALGRVGDRRGSRQAVVSAIQARQGPEPEPFVSYLLGHSSRARETFDDLRREISRRHE